MSYKLATKRALEVDALSPMDANAQRLPPKATELKPRAAPVKAKNKDHPPPPPAEVPEPPSADRPNGATYTVGKMLGKGGFAICYEGQLQPTRQRFALKMVKKQMPSKMESKFQTELQIHSKMKHKNIVQFFRAFSFNECTYLTLELCPNGSLMDMVKRRKGLTEAEVRFYSVQIAGAIKYMHAKGVIHRDLKMGNIFLDAGMNAKIGDFGLAALLVTGKDMQTIRRTTLCGTPNYIAPEILEKGRTGHDHSVDLWSLGVIVFAMLTSKPPFQSTTTDEIYRRARELDYEWPSNDTGQCFTSDEIKDLVATMLQDPKYRLSPDEFIEHPFFTSGYMPSEAEMTPRLRELPPDKQEFYMTRLTSSSTQRASDENFVTMCRECCVGPLGQAGTLHAQVWKEMAAEEKAGLTPMIPLADEIVYRPFDEWLEEQQQDSTLKLKLAGSIRSHARAQRDPGESSSQKAPTGLLRQPPQSFAAQQRAQGRPLPSRAIPSRPATTAAVPKPKAAVDSTDAESGTQSVRQRVRREVVRETPLASVAVANAKAESALEPRTGARTVQERTREPRQTPMEPTSKVSEKMSLASSMSSMSSSTSHRRQKSNSMQMGSLFSPTESQAPLRGSEPDAILDRLRRLQTEMERALNARSMAFVNSKQKSVPLPHIVVKWVDYTNKFGLGYILNDGAVGCILRDIPATEGTKTVMLPPAGITVKNGERHLHRRHDREYADRYQPVPMSEPIKFFENKGEAGLSEVEVSPQAFRVTINADGTVGKMNPGTDLFQHRKRERIILWKKFANYMMANGREDAGEGAESAMPPGEAGPGADMVTFYQRFGDVGCWVYGDGHMQFNFPDHTKIVIDATGTWCHFWHLPEGAANRLAAEGEMEASELDNRGMLSYPLQTMLNFHSKSSARSTTRQRPIIGSDEINIPTSNDFRRKVEFIKNVVKEWVNNGGMGNSSMDRATRQRWTGHRERTSSSEPLKHVWVTVGARWGDQRLTTLFDPRKPWDLGEDVETPSRR
ncbi:serine/threonine protein kinase [Emericellopsis atlantica]|uniref:Serine/threonine protein kinase n=1 Tax=Emericellopsis atlantica TaxID=2614577 RepID=A0A9P7ZKX0_9HYPO|nr:serine/threonine protein kinase [Emericellopsis atlantica]KAG9253612.1 serine/threonine protein kinase [Emericellopsis atlantica]